LYRYTPDPNLNLAMTPDVSAALALEAAALEEEEEVWAPFPGRVGTFHDFTTLFCKPN
jgi:hypothetical protein